MNQNETGEEKDLRPIVLSLGERLAKHCEKIESILHGFETKHIDDPEFNLKKPFRLTDSSMTRITLMQLSKTYEDLRSEVREISENGFIDFELMYPKIDINFETYYSVAFSLMNLIYQMRLMKLYCYRLLSE